MTSRSSPATRWPCPSSTQPPIASVARDTLLLGRTAADCSWSGWAVAEPRTVLLPTTFTPRPQLRPGPRGPLIAQTEPGVRGRGPRAAPGHGR